MSMLIRKNQFYMEFKKLIQAFRVYTDSGKLKSNGLTELDSGDPIV